MSIKDIKTIKLTDYETSTLQNNIGDFAQQLVRVPFLDGNLIEDVSLSTTATEVAHGLGREPVGYFIVKANAAVDVYDTTSTTPKVTIKLTASTTATCNIWIF
jgi:hypothetical protein